VGGAGRVRPMHRTAKVHRIAARPVRGGIPSCICEALLGVMERDSQESIHEGATAGNTDRVSGVQPSFGVGIPWSGIHAGGGWNCLPTLGGTGQAQGLPLPWPWRSLMWGRRVGPQGRPSNCRGLGTGIRGQELRGEVAGGRAREGLARRPHGRIGTGRVGDMLASRTHGGRSAGPPVAPGCIRTHIRRRVEGCQGGVAGGVPPHKGGPQARPSNCRGQGSGDRG